MKHCSLHSSLLKPPSVAAGWKLVYFPVKCPFPLRLGSLFQLRLAGRYKRQAGRYLRLLCTPACFWLSEIFSLSLARLPGKAQQPDGGSSWDSAAGKTTLNRTVFALLSLNAHTSTSELNESCDLWPFSEYLSGVWKCMSTNERAGNLSARKQNFFFLFCFVLITVSSNRYTTTWGETGFKSLPVLCLSLWVNLSAKRHSLWRQTELKSFPKSLETHKEDKNCTEEWLRCCCRYLADVIAERCGYRSCRKWTVNECWSAMSHDLWRFTQQARELQTTAITVLWFVIRVVEENNSTWVLIIHPLICHVELTHLFGQQKPSRHSAKLILWSFYRKYALIFFLLPVETVLKSVGKQLF